ncbi:MAG: transcriptional regulator [Opitutus sp.]|nr:transcriptional regulator [Opitutus sp.]
MFIFMAQAQSSNDPRRPTNLDLFARVRRAVTNGPTDRPLPTTREFGKRFGVANTTVFRILQKLTQDGEIWQHPTSGRYYPATARALLDRPKPVACLIRRLELDSEQYRELLEGVSVGCGALHRTMLLWHDELLVNHPNPHEPPVFAQIAQQRAILNDFLDRHGDAAGGFVLDHVWGDDSLRVHAARLKPAVVLFRSCDLESYSNISADFRSGALKALAHLLGRGFEQIIPIEPFLGDPAVAEFSAALVTAADELGCRSRLSPIEPGGTDQERTQIIDRLRRSTKRTALVCPEDNVTALLAAAASVAGLHCPTRVGLLSVMGTDFATRAGISCLRYDFRKLGRMAIDAIGSSTPVRGVLEPQFFSGTTT